MIQDAHSRYTVILQNLRVQKKRRSNLCHSGKHGEQNTHRQLQVIKQVCKQE